MAKVIKLAEDQQKSRVQDLMMEIPLRIKSAEPHFRAIKEIEAEIEVMKLKIQHILEEHIPECRSSKSVNYNYDEDTQDIIIEILTDKEALKAKMPKDIPDPIKDLLSGLLDGMEKEGF